jgi:hypothetical protein
MFKNRLVLSALALSIAAAAALTTAGPAQADTPAPVPVSAVSSVVAPVVNTVAPDDSCWD